MFFEKASDEELEAELIPLMRQRAMAQRAVELARQLHRDADENVQQVRDRLDAVQDELERRYEQAARKAGGTSGLPASGLPLTLEER